MSTVNALNNSAAQANTSQRALTSNEFLQIMLTELTNQDPMDPMSNRELVEQIASIQELESNQQMSDRFLAMTNQFNNTLSQFESFISQQKMNAAGQMIGEIVTGITLDGIQATGKVVAVNVNEYGTFLELDTGELVAMENMQRLGGSSSNDIVGSLIMGTTKDKVEVVGVVESIDVSGSEVILRLESGMEVPLSNASLINSDTARYLENQYVEGTITDNNGDPQTIKGIVKGIRYGSNDLVTLLLDDGSELPLMNLTKITINQE